MDFFQHQDRAKKRTGLLVTLFLIALLTIAVLASAVLLFAYCMTLTHMPDEKELLIYFIVSVAIVSASMLGASGIRMYELSSSGGGSIAEKLGGRLISTNIRTAKYRQLLNVVEEMAIASGISVPQVYVLERESGLNAFAAGMSIDDAAIAVTQGALNRFNREELQGVIAHEFSHILNGDMRLNTRLMGILFGITFIAQTGRTILEGFSEGTRVRGYRNSDTNKAAGAMLIGGIGFLVVGWLGLFFSSMIKAAISRQREFLADASAVQFTRNDQGIVKALVKIGSISQGSSLVSQVAQEASHMMFGQSAFRGVDSWFATHPPLEERIKRIDASWDGKFVYKPSMKSKASSEAISGFAQAGAFSADAFSSDKAAGELAELGQSIISQIPEQLVEMAREPYSARIIPLLLIYDGTEQHKKQILQHIPMGMISKIESLMIDPIPVHLRLPLLELAIPALKSLSEPQLDRLIEILYELSQSDGYISFPEWCVISLVEKQVLPPLGNAPDNKSVGQLKEVAINVLSELAHSSHSSPDHVQKAFSAATNSLGWDDQKPKAANTEWATLKASLNLLVQLKPKDKSDFLQACQISIESDDKVSTKEADLHRLITAFLEVPVPPLMVDLQ